MSITHFIFWMYSISQPVLIWNNFLHNVSFTMNFVLLGRYIAQSKFNKLKLQNNFWSNILNTAKVGPARKYRNIRGGSFLCHIVFVTSFFSNSKRVWQGWIKIFSAHSSKRRKIYFTRACLFNVNLPVVYFWQNYASSTVKNSAKFTLKFLFIGPNFVFIEF